MLITVTLIIIIIIAIIILFITFLIKIFDSDNLRYWINLFSKRKRNEENFYDPLNQVFSMGNC